MSASPTIYPIIEEIPLADVIPGRWQPRQAFDPDSLAELAASIQEHGQIDPALVWANYDGALELVAGERRWRAVCALRLAESYPEHSLNDWAAKVAQADPRTFTFGQIQDWADGITLLARRVACDDPADLHLLALVDNLERDNLSPIEEARAFQSLMELNNWRQRQLARQIGRSQGYVQQRLALLDLSPEVQEAVNTRVFTATHARAIGQVPQELQKAVTDWTLSDKGAPVTTRDLEKATREVAKFTNPNRWQPNPETIYRPELRNRLALVRWALQQADLERSADLILGLRDREYYQGGNLLAKAARTVVDRTAFLDVILKALHMAPLAKTWPKFAQATGRLCANCILNDHPRPVDESYSISDHYCRRWNEQETETCQYFIGAEDPVVIPAYWDIRSAAQLADLPLVFEPFEHFTDPAHLVTAIQLDAQAKTEKTSQAEQEAQTEYLETMRAFLQWQESLPEKSLRHPLAHACGKCSSYLPGQDPPCFFAGEPLPSRLNDRPRPPRFHALVSQEGVILPRCETFRCQELLPFYPHEGTVLVDRDQVLSWIGALITNANTSNFGFYGILSWIDYVRPLDKETHVKKLLRWIKNHWDEIGGDPVIPTLIDVIIAENAACASYSRSGIVPVINPVTDQEERYAAAKLSHILGEESWSSWKPWPKNWPQPWVTDDDPEDE